MVFKDYFKKAFEKLQEAYRKKPALTIAAGFILVLLLGTIFLTGEDDSTTDISPYTVKAGPLRISIVETGTIQPKEKIIVKNEIEGQTSIVYIVKEGASVKKGDLLVELDSSTMTDNKVDQEIQVLGAEATFIDARENLSVTQSQAESDVDQAELAYEFAKQDLEKYNEGEYPNKLKQAEATITLAEETLAEAQETVEWSKKLYEEQFISASELESDQLTYKKKALDLDLAKRDLDLLVNYTHSRDLSQLESDVKQAKMALDRIQRKAIADVVQAEASFKAKDAEYTRQQDKLKKLEAQLLKTKIYAPADGSVIYATSAEQQGRRFSRSEPLELGSSVKERQELIHLPTNTGFMVEVSIAESSIDKVRKGLPAIISVDTLPGEVFTGRVQTVSSVVDAMSAFMNPDLKVYTTQVLLDDTEKLSLIRAGMSCTAEIVVAQYEEATYVPVQAVLNVEGKQTAYVLKGNDLEPRVVETGMDNGIVIKIDSGLKSGELVALNPPLKEAVTVEQSFEQLSDTVASLPKADLSGTGGEAVAAQGPPSGAGGNSQQAEGAAPGSRYITRSDTDGDGRISESEFQGTSDDFSSLDKNGDGYISADEAPQRRPSGDATGGGQARPDAGLQGGQMPGFGGAAGGVR